MSGDEIAIDPVVPPLKGNWRLAERTPGLPGVMKGEEIHPGIHRERLFTRALENSYYKSRRKRDGPFWKLKRRKEIYPMTERRKDRRIKEENRVVIEVSPSGGQGKGLTINAFTKDISLSGARIWTDRVFPLHSRLNLTLYLSRSRQVVRLRSIVVWEKECYEGLYEIGVQFQHGIPEAVMALIKHFYGKEEAIPTELNRGRT